MQPTIGRIVHYKLSEGDVVVIDQQQPMYGTDGTRAQRNPVSEGHVYPALVVRVFEPGYCNLQVFLDGDCSYWATSRVEGTESGQWSWPPRV